MSADASGTLSEQTENWGLRAVRKALGQHAGKSPLPFMKTTGLDKSLTLLHAEHGKLVMEWTPDDSLDAFDGIVFGGALTALGDFVQAHVFTSLLEKPGGFSTIDFHTRYLRPVPSGQTYKIESRLVDRAARTAIIDMVIYRADGKATTHITGAWQLADRAFELENG